MSASSRSGHARSAAADASPAGPGPSPRPRPRLERLLDAWLHVPVVVVEGPPGSGKSQLVSGWAVRALAQGRIRDVHGLGSGRGDGTPVPRSHGVGRSADGPVLHVVDHRAPTAAGTLDHLVELACLEPDGVHVVLMSRDTSRDPRARPLRLVADRDRVRVLPALALALTAAEAAVIVRQRWPRASDRHVRALLDVTHGWLGLLEAAVRELPTPGGAPRDLVRALAACPTGALLMAESVASLGDDDADTLLALSVVPSFDAAEAAALAGRCDVDLEALAAAGLVVSLDRSGREPRWGVHPVLREHLGGLAGPGTPARRVVAAARTRASGHFARLGRPVAAVEHALASHDVDVITDAVVELGPALVALGRADLLAPAHLLLLADPVRARHPSLLAVEALRLRAAGDVAGALDVARRAVDLAAPRPVGDASAPSLRADLALLDLWTARRGWVDPVPALAAAGHLLDGASFESHPELSVARRAALAVELGAVHLWAGAVDEAALHLERAVSLVDGTGYVHIRASALASRALAELVAGALHAAAATVQECLALAAPTPSQPLDVARADAVAAWLAFYRHEDDAVRHHLDAAEHSGADDLDPVVQVLTRLLRARTSVREGCFDTAWRLLSSRTVLRQDLPPFLARLVHVVRAESYAAQQDMTGLRTEAQTLRASGEEDDARLFEAVAAVVAGDVAGAAHAFETLTLRPTRHVTTGLAAAACRVLLLLRTDPEAVAGPLQDLLSRVWSSGAVVFLTVGLDAGPAYATALRREAQDPHGHPWAGTALVLLQRAAPGLDRPAPSAPAAGGDPLTARELAVLRGLADGLSYADVAQLLFITPNTVKTHVGSLYRKLGVESGLQAVSAARRQGLLP